MEKNNTGIKQLHRTMFGKTGALLMNMGAIFIRRSTIVEIICTLFIILYIYTGLNKLMDYSEFRIQMERSPFIGHMSGLIAATLPPGELLIAIALVLKRFRLLGLYLSLFLMALFTGYIWLMLQYAHDLPCTCGGVLAKMSWRDHLIFNSAFTGLAIAGILLQDKISVTKKLAKPGVPA